MKTSDTRERRVRAASQLRRDAQKTELRQTILDAAGALFLEVGYERFSMRQVAERIGYTATTIYRYFENKDALIFAIVDLGFERFGRALDDAARSTSDPIERIEALGRAYIRFGVENPVYYQLMFMQRTDYLATPKDGTKEPRLATFGTLQHAVEAAIASGDLPPGDPTVRSHAIWSLVHGTVSIALTLGAEVGLDALRTYEMGSAMMFGREPR